MTMNKCDVAIIGAGPAGSVLARELSSCRPDLRIALIDSGGKKVCGGLLSPDAQKVLACLGLSLPVSVLADPQIFDVKTVDLASGCVRHYQRNYLNMDRALFDGWLLSLVPKSVKILRGKCVCVERDSPSSYKLSIRSGNEIISIESDCVVGADGASSIVRRTFFKKLPYRYVAIQQRFNNREGSLPPYSCIFDPSTSDSCSWTVLKSPYAIFGGAFKIKGCRGAFEEQKEHFERFLSLSLGTPVLTEACMLTRPRRFRDLCVGKENIFLIGEAAAFISASSFEGISYALTSAKLLADAFGTGNNTKNIFKRYKRSTLPMRLKLFAKIVKRAILCSPILRFIIMKSGIQSIKKY